jgi:predicted RNA binding protein YcfA (HicA-like mRNA interferase family)
MDAMELKEILKSAGWTFHRQKRSGHFYLYATQRRGKKTVTTYLAPEHKAERLTKERVLALLDTK